MFNFDGNAGGGNNRVSLAGRGQGRRGVRAAGEDTRNDFVKRQHKEREARERKRLQEQAATTIQAAFRAYRCLQAWKATQRQVFDKKYADVAKLSAMLPPSRKGAFIFHALLPMIRLCVFFFAPAEDGTRLSNLVELVVFSAGQAPPCNILRLVLGEEEQSRSMLALFERMLRAMLRVPGMSGDVARLLLGMHATLFSDLPDYSPVDPARSAGTLGHVLQYTKAMDALTRDVLPATLASPDASGVQELSRIIVLCCEGLQVCSDATRQEGFTHLLSTPGLGTFLSSPDPGARGPAQTDCLRRLLASLPPPPAAGTLAGLLAEELQGQAGQMPRCVWLASNLLVVMERSLQAILGDSSHGLHIWLAWLCWAKEGPAGSAKEVLASELERLNRSSYVRELMQAVERRGPEELLAVCQLYFSVDSHGGGISGGEPSTEVVQTLAFATPLASRLFPSVAALLEGSSEVFEALGAPTFASPVAVQLRVFCIVYGLWMQPMYDCEFFGEANALQLAEVQALASFLNRFAYRLISGHPDKASMAPAARSLRTAVTSLLGSLYNRHCRRTILEGERPWVIPDSRCFLRGSPVVDLEGAPEEEDDNMGVDPPAAAVAAAASSGGAYAAHGSRGVPESEQVLEALLDEIPHVLPFEDRVTLLHNVIRSDQDQRRSSRGPWGPAAMQRHSIRRSNLVEDGFGAFASLAEENGQLRDVFRVQFVADDGSPEAGVDGGGLFKEFMVHICRAMFDPEFGLFDATSEQTLYPAAGAFWVHHRALELYCFLGKVVGKAIYEMFLLEPQFSRVFLNRLLGRMNELDDLAALDQELLRNMLLLRESRNVEGLGLTFSVAVSAHGHHEEIDLVPNGRSAPVTKENLTRYSHLLANFKTNVQLQRHTNAFLRGLQCVIPAAWIKMFDPYELNILISGSHGGFDVMDLRRHTVYGGGFTEDSPVIQWLWQLLQHHTDPEDMGRFLMFATSCSRAPLLGFKTLYPQFCIHRVPDSLRLPTASTCANLLKLPEYLTPDVLREKILQAIRASAGFDLS